MRTLIISDIHANLTALETILAHAGKIDSVWCLGDLVGYGPDPNECIKKVSELPNLTCVIGNHDAAVIDQIDPISFNYEARTAINWTKNCLSKENRGFLENLPRKAEIGDVTLVHGSPRQPVWEYLLDITTATRSFNYFTTPFCFIGHTHLPMQYQLEDGKKIAWHHVPKPNTHRSLTPRAIMNPGSVGQPRDRDSRAAYAIYIPQEHTWENYRVTYDLSSVQKRMREYNMPERHIIRLSNGW